MCTAQDPLVVGIDFGTSGLKLVVVDRQGDLRSSHRLEYPVLHPGADMEAGQVEQAPEHWWDAFRQAIAEAVVLPGLARQVVAVGLTGQMQDLILLDAAGMPLAPAILYSDLRARAEFDELAADLPDWAERSGNTQDASGMMPKLLWLDRHRPALLEASHEMVFGPAAAVARRLGAPPLTDLTTASTTGLYELSRRRWWRHGLRALQTRSRTRRLASRGPDLLPGLTTPASVACRLSNADALDLGLPEGTPVVLGLGDAGAMTDGLSGSSPGGAYASLGSSGWIAGVLDSDRRRTPTPPSAVHRLAMGDASDLRIAAVQSAGTAADWARRELLAGMSPQAAEEAAVDRLGELSQRPLCLPSLTGERYPVRDAAARGAFVGIRPETTAVDLYLAVLGGVAYSLAAAVEELDLRQPVLPTVGGGANSRVWCQLLADATGMQVLAVPRAEDAAAHHAARAAAGAVMVGHQIRPLADPRHGAGAPPQRLTGPSSLAADHQRRRRLHRELHSSLQETFAALQG